MIARERGLEAGRLLLSPSLNPYPHGSAEALSWDQAWREAQLADLQRRLAERKALERLSMPCIYERGEICRCGGRGLCLAVA